MTVSATILLASAMATLPPRPEAPGPESWTFREELAASEGAPPPVSSEGTYWLKDRISRCSFGPIKRAPYNRDELMDDVDYYPDGYLEKLRRDGVNGLWITVEFHEIAETRFFPRDKNAERRIAKLRRTVEKCGRYGIKVWIFALEPKWLTEDHPFRKANPAMFVQRGDHFAMCPELPEVREYLESAAKDVFTRVPGLGGFIGITHGEDITSCFSYNGRGCPRCAELPRWRMHNDIVGALARGARAANPEARVISWFYQPEAQVTRPDWVYECVAHLPEGVTLMYNFESGSLVKQLDRWRVGGDYWLSQPGPAQPFAKLADVARANGTKVAAKIQMACSHEDATVPYIPVPGLLYRKFKAMRDCGVESAMLSWYFGNFPCVMSRAAGMLARGDFGESEESFLLKLARTTWGEDEAPRIVRLWQGFARAYADYPVSNYMQYYGPYHAGVVWALYPQVEMKPLEPTWMPHYAPAGDAIGECLRDFTLDEALALSQSAAEMPEPDFAGTNREQALDLGVMKAVRRQFIAARDDFAFYRERSEAIYRSRVLKDPAVARKSVARMREIVAREKALSEEMIALCEADSRLGFHSEAEAHQFFPARLKWRMDVLSEADEDLKSIDGVLAGGGSYPESEHERTAPRLYVGLDKWTEGTDGFKCRVYRLENGDLQLEGEVNSKTPSVTFALYDAAATQFPRAYSISRDGTVTAPFWNGEARDTTAVTAKTWTEGDRWAFKFVLSASVWGGTERLRPGWVFFYADRGKSLWPKDARWQELGRLWHPLTPSQFGRIVDEPPPDDLCDKPYEPVARSMDTNNWYGARMAEKREAIASSGGTFDLVFVGDSITHFWEKCSWFKTDGSAELAALRRRFSILDLGFAGDGTEHVLWRLKNGQADGYAAKCFMLLIGTNNKRGPVEDVARGVGAIVDLLRERHPESKILLVSVFPRDLSPDGPMRARMERLNALTERFVDGVNVWRIDFCDRFLKADGTLDLRFFCPDQVHLSPEGYRLWRSVVEPVFESLAGDTRPYEFIDALRTTDEVAPWIDFESGPSWRAGPADKAFVENSAERMLFGTNTLKLTYSAAEEIRLRPSAPLPLPDDHDWFGVWLRNSEANRKAGKGAPTLNLVFRRKGGEEVRLPLRHYYGSSRMDWPDWWYAVRCFSESERKILSEPGMSFDGFALSGCSNTAPTSVYVDNIAFFSRDESKRLDAEKIPEVGIPTRPEGALPASSADGAANETVREGDVVRFRYAGPDGKLEYVWSGSPDALTASWNGGPAFRPMAGGGARTAKASYVPSIVGKTLVLEVAAPAGTTSVSMGHVADAKVLSRTLIPTLGDGYWWDENRSKVSAVDDGRSRFFVLAFPDWYVSAATAVVGEKQADGTFDRVCTYRAKTDGTLNPVSERLYVTVSPDLMETLPVIANPVSPWKKVTGTKAWCRYSSGPNRAESRRFLTWLHRHGIRELVINEHECCMRDDGESFTFRGRSAPRKGGDEAWRAYADYVINTLGYRYGPYNNFTDLAPVNANWGLDRVSRKSPLPDVPDAGGLVPAWTRCYAPKAGFAYASCVRYAPLLKKRYGFNTAYCDVHTAILPWEYVDCDARVPDGGKFQPFYRAYAGILLEQKKAWEGPVYSEGTSQFFYAGLADGNYGQLGIRTEKDPWIVDFDLRRIHPLECDFGVGNLDMFLPGLPRESSAPELVGAVDRFLAATLAFGHTPYLVLDMMTAKRCNTGGGYPSPGNSPTPDIGLPYALRSYYMVQPAAALYTQSEAREILYRTDGGWLDVSAAVLSGDRKLQCIAVRYADGTCVVANGDVGRRLGGNVFGRAVDLPPCGYLVWNEARGLEIEAGDRMGARTDYSASEDAIYLDTRDAQSECVFPHARGRGLAICRREGSDWEVIPVRGEVVFNVSGREIRAAAGNAPGSAVRR